MISKILSNAIEQSGFVEISSNNSISFYSKIDGAAKRFLILVYSDSIVAVDELHEFVFSKVPESIRQDSAYNKNTDLILVVKFEKLDDFREEDKLIFSIEENSYFFKKYVLYYTKGEEDIFCNKDFNDLKSVIVNKNDFLNYKNNPTFPSFYAVAARIFIKLPFLELTINESVLVPLGIQARETVSRLDAEQLNLAISTTSDGDLDGIISGLIKNEMENI